MPKKIGADGKWHVTPGRGGRPSKLIQQIASQSGVDGASVTITPEIEDHLANRIAEGCPLAVAIDALGVNRESAYRQLRESKTLGNKLSRARETLIVNRLKNIVVHEPDDWRASAWILERTVPEHFSQKAQVQVSQSTPGLMIEATVIPQDVVVAPAKIEDAKEEKS